MQILAAIPSPSRSVWHLGPLPIRAYALCIIAGILVAVWIADRRLRARGAGADDVWDVAKWAVPFGIVGGRIYHVITDPELYFTKGADPVNALRIWDGGLGIPGAIALGTLGAWIGCRRRGIRLDSFGDAAVPGVALAQAIGRWGNWFNNELYGRSTDLPWKLQIHCVDISAGSTGPCAGREGEVLGYFQPTFLYESLWDLALAGGLVWAGRRWALGHGRVFALYAMGYAVGRFWVEALRSDPANHILGLRVNTWTSLLVFVGGLIWFLTHRGPREESIFRDGRDGSPGLPAAEPGAAEPAVSEPDAAEPGPPEPAAAEPGAAHSNAGERVNRGS
ncbi:MAG: prolipoprotein diacylglyceryl transferase [Actinomycetota bacterium]|nr:prolipoprotein diacylglyceryl transferase [Actinomycetota bacterium]